MLLCLTFCYDNILGKKQLEEERVPLSMIPTLVRLPDLGCSEGCTLFTSPMGLLHGRTHPWEAEDVGLTDQVTA